MVTWEEMDEWKNERRIAMQQFERDFVGGGNGQNSYSVTRTSVLSSAVVMVFFLYSIACVLCVLFDLSRFFYYRIAGPISQRCVLKLTVILTTNQAFQTAGSVNNRWSKAVPPWGTLHFPELSHCVFSLTALFALRLSHKRESEPPVAVITAPLK